MEHNKTPTINRCEGCQGRLPMIRKLFLYMIGRYRPCPLSKFIKTKNYASEGVVRHQLYAHTSSNETTFTGQPQTNLMGVEVNYPAQASHVEVETKCGGRIMAELQQ